MAGRAVALALAAHTVDLGDGRVDDVALVGVHRLHLIVAARADDAVCNAPGKGREVVLALVAVAADIQAQLDVRALHAVHNEAGEVGQGLHRLAAASDQRAHVLAGDLQDCGSALLDGGEGEVFHTHQVEDRGQVVNGGLQARVGVDVKGNLDFLTGDGGQLGLLDHILDDLLLDFRGGLVRDFNNLGGLCGNFSRLFRLGLLDLHEDLGGNGLKQLAGGEFEDFVAYVDVITVNAESLAGGLYGGLNGLGAHFHTAHRGNLLLILCSFYPLAPSGRGLRPQAVGERAVRSPAIFRVAARFSPSGPAGPPPSQREAGSVINPYSAGWCARPCRVRPRAGGPSPGAACWPRPG